MKKILHSMALLPLIIGGLSVSASAADGINLLDDLKLSGEIRPRYENVNDGKSDTANANALTTRIKLNVEAKKLFNVEGLSANLGMITVQNFGFHEYNWNNSDYRDGTKKYSTVMDPQTSILSNADINYQINKTTLHAGRGQVNLDNQRFIGTVGWRQLERSYDSVFVADNSVKNLNLLAAWVYGFQGVTESDTVNANTVLLHASYKVMDELTVTAYDYMIAAKKDATGGFGSDTYGLALTGNLSIANAKVNYRAEYAKQGNATMDYQKTITNNDNFKADAHYYNLDLGANISGILAGINYEVLSGENTSGSETAFATPLATAHKFNGWADMFLATPKGGLQDTNIRLGYKAKGFGKILAVYHDYSTDTNVMDDVNSIPSDDLGSEFDAVYVNKIPGVNGLTGLVKYAAYSKGKVVGYTHDKDIAWVQLDYKF